MAVDHDRSLDSGGSRGAISRLSVPAAPAELPQEHAWSAEQRPLAQAEVQSMLQKGAIDHCAGGVLCERPVSGPEERGQWRPVVFESLPSQQIHPVRTLQDGGNLSGAGPSSERRLLGRST